MVLGVIDSWPLNIGWRGGFFVHLLPMRILTFEKVQFLRTYEQSLLNISCESFLINYALHISLFINRSRRDTGLPMLKFAKQFRCWRKLIGFIFDNILDVPWKGFIFLILKFLIVLFTVEITLNHYWRLWCTSSSRNMFSQIFI